MPKKNLILFFIFSVVILYGWSFLQRWLFPPPPKKDKPKPAVEALAWKALTPEARGSALVAGLIGSQGATAPVVDANLRLATELAALEGRSDRLLFVAQAPKPKPVEAPEVVPVEQHEFVELGKDKDSNLSVTLTTEGGGIRGLILNKFQQANGLGRPVWQNNDGKTPEPLHLIPWNKDWTTPVSFVLYHYANPEEKHPEHPVDTLGKRKWKIVTQPRGPDGEQKVAFSTDSLLKDFKVTKTFTLSPEDYHLTLTVEIERTSTNPEALPFRYQLTGAEGMPIEGEWYTTTYRTAMIGLVDNKGFADRDVQDSLSIGRQLGGHDVPKSADRFIRYAGTVTQYFASVLAVDVPQDKGVAPNFLAWARPTVEGPPVPGRPFLDDTTMRVVTDELRFKPGEKIIHRYVLYNGPVKVGLLDQLPHVNQKAVADYENKLFLNTLTDYYSPTWFGRNITGPTRWSALLIYCTNRMHDILWYLHKVVPNYGVCIILLTVLVRGMMFPLSRRQALASARMQAKMEELKPEIKKLEEKHRNDSMALQQAKQELYLKRGVNPLAMMGSCWLVFLQMPIFLGLYYALQESIHFRLAPFWPLWIKNLAAPDMMIWWTENIPWISKPDDMGSFLYLGPYFNLFPIVAVVLMIVQQKMLAPPPADEQAAMQQKMMSYMMIFFGVMFYKVAAGLCVYFIASSLWGLTERKLLPKKQAAKAAQQPAAAPGRAKRAAPSTNGNGVLQKVKDWWEKVLKEARKK